MKKKGLLKRRRVLVASVLCICFIISPQLRVSRVSASLAAVSLRSESQLKTEANLYDTAIREIAQIGGMPLATPDDVKRVDSILKKQIPNLRYNRSKLVVMGLTDSSFMGAARTQTQDKNITEEFAKDLAKDTNAIYKLNGARSLGDRIARSFETDTAMLRKVGERLKRAAADLRANTKSHHARSTPAALSFASSGLANSSDGIVGTEFVTQGLRLTESQVIVLVIAAAVIAYPPLVVAIVNLSPAVYAAGIAAGTASQIAKGAVDLYARLIANIGTEKSRDKVAECFDDRDAAYNSCAARANSLCCGFGIPELLLCDGIWLLDTANCLLLE